MSIGNRWHFPQTLASTALKGISVPKRAAREGNACGRGCWPSRCWIDNNVCREWPCTFQRLPLLGWPWALQSWEQHLDLGATLLGRHWTQQFQGAFVLVQLFLSCPAPAIGLSPTSLCLVQNGYNPMDWTQTNANGELILNWHWKIGEWAISSKSRMARETS